MKNFEVMNSPRQSQNNGGSARASVAIGLMAVAAFTYATLFVTRELIAPGFSYQGYVDRSWEKSEIVFAAAASALLGAVSSQRSKRTASFAVGFLLATVAIPLLWIPVFYGPLDEAGVLQIQLATLLGFGILWLSANLPARPIRLLLISEPVYLILILLSVSAIFAVLILFYGIRPAIFSLDEVYDQRDEYNASIGTLGRYLIGILTNALLPVLIVFGASRKRYGVLAFGIAGFVLVYTMTGFKSYIVGLILTLVAIKMVNRRRIAPSTWFVVFFLAVCAGYIFDRISGGIIFSSILTRRAITTSGVNSSYFFDYFGDAETYRLRHSFLSFLGEAPYDLSPARLIGEVYYNSETMAANANILADGYANFGFVGAIAACVAAGVYLWIYQKTTNHLPIEVSMPVLVLLLIAWANTAVFTSFVTHGGFILAVLVALMPWQERCVAPSQKAP